MDYKTTDTSLTAVANAIRNKTGKTTALEWPNEYVTEINKMPSFNPIPTIEPDPVWVRPYGYPDLDSLIYPEDANEIYYVFDKKLGRDEIRFWVNKNAPPLEVGHIENERFVVDKTFECGATASQITINFSEIDEDAFLLRVPIGYGYSLNISDKWSVYELYCNFDSSGGPYSLQDFSYYYNLAHICIKKPLRVSLNRDYSLVKIDGKMLYPSDFSYCYSLRYIDFSSFNTSNATNMSNMFYNCKSLQSLDLSSFDTSNVTNMSGMFQGCDLLQSLDLSSFDTSNVTNMSNMFYNCKSLRTVDFSSFDTSNVTNMNNMFKGCYSLQSLDLSPFDVSNVTTMSYMFQSCKSLQSLNLSSFGINNVSNMTYMFSTCTSLTTLDLSSFDTSNVTDMSGMFQGCYLLQSLDLSSFDTSNVTDMNGMFWDCVLLQSLDLSSFDTSNVTSMSYMFSDCPNLRSLDLSSFNTSKVARMVEMFHKCRLYYLNISSFTFDSIASSESASTGECVCGDVVFPTNGIPNYFFINWIDYWHTERYLTDFFTAIYPAKNPPQELYVGDQFYKITPQIRTIIENKGYTLKN